VLPLFLRNFLRFFRFRVLFQDFFENRLSFHRRDPDTVGIDCFRHVGVSGFVVQFLWWRFVCRVLNLHSRTTHCRSRPTSAALRILRMFCFIFFRVLQSGTRRSRSVPGAICAAAGTTRVATGTTCAAAAAAGTTRVFLACWSICRFQNILRPRRSGGVKVEIF